LLVRVTYLFNGMTNPTGLWVTLLVLHCHHVANKRAPTSHMRSVVLTAVKMSMLVFWVVTPCGLVGRYQRFRGTYCLLLQGFLSPSSAPKMEALCFSETLVSTFKSTRRYYLEDQHRQFLIDCVFCRFIIKERWCEDVE
jgi:hypothetical protein